MDYKELTNCLCCNSTDLYKFLDLGEQPLANSFGVESAKYPLEVNLCRDCTHSQLNIALDPKLLFVNYTYLTGINEAHRKYFREFASKCSGTSILDIGSNDGSLLDEFIGWERWAVEPAENLSNLYEGKSICLISEFFPTKIERKFDVITAFNVFAHNSNPLEFMKACKELLEEDGRLYIQTSQKDFIENGEFDTVYHEHISYFTINSMAVLASYADMRIEGVETVDFLGKSMLFTLKANAIKKYDSMQASVGRLKDSFLAAAKEPFVLYSVPAKAVVLLNAIGIWPEYAVDDNQLKQGTNIPGTNCPIYHPSQLLDDKRNLNILVGAWNVYEDIKEKIRTVRGTADKLIRVFPTLVVE